MEDTKKRKGYKNIEAQMEADKKWREKNKKHRNYLSKRGVARSFIRNNATKEDLDELMEILKEAYKKFE